MPVVLRDIEEWSYEEIAVSLELPIGTVKSRIARGRGQLKEILTPLLAKETPMTDPTHPASSAEFLSRLYDGELDPADRAAFERAPVRVRRLPRGGRAVRAIARRLPRVGRSRPRRRISRRGSSARSARSLPRGGRSASCSAST